MPVISRVEKAAYDNSVVAVQKKLNMDGSQPMMGSLDLNNFRIVGLYGAELDYDATNLKQVNAKLALGKYTSTPDSGSTSLSDVWRVGEETPNPGDLSVPGSWLWM